MSTAKLALIIAVPAAAILTTASLPMERRGHSRPLSSSVLSSVRGSGLNSSSQLVQLSCVMATYNNQNPPPLLNCGGQSNGNRCGGCSLNTGLVTATAGVNNADPLKKPPGFLNCNTMKQFQGTCNDFNCVGDPGIFACADQDQIIYKSEQVL
jgi:hypothetical protein